MKKIVIILTAILITVSLASCGTMVSESIGNSNLDKAPILGEDGTLKGEDGENTDSAVTKTDTWDGTADTSWYTADKDSFVLTTAEQLAGLEKLSNETTDFTGVTIKLAVNMDMCGRSWTPIGFKNSTKFTPDGVVNIKNFSGTLDGNGATIYNLSVEADEAALIATNRGTVKNCNVSGAVSNGSTVAACLVGTNSGTVENCSANGTVRVEKKISSGSDTLKIKAGVLVGSNLGRIDNCYSAGEVFANSESTGGYTETYSYVGGLVGHSSGGQITNCYSDAAATAESNGNLSTTQTDSACGGLIGYCKDTEVKSCYATGSVKASAKHKYSSRCNAYAGGLIGQTVGNNVFNNNYRCSDQELKALINENDYLVFNSEGMAKSLSDIRTLSFHTDTLGWDASLWDISNGQPPKFK